MPKLNIPKVLALSLGVLALIFSLNYLVMAVWTEPGVAPPGANVPAPINTGTSSQVKLGGLGVSGSFAADGGAAAGKGLNVINGNVSIGTSTVSTFPLSFKQAVGNKIALWDAGATSFGLGIQASILQIFASLSTSRVGIGYGNSSNATSFTETLTVKGPNVGIGIIPSSTSTYRFNVNGSVKVGGTISGVSTPVNGTDAANKDYVDAASGDDVVVNVNMPLQGVIDYSPQQGSVSTIPLSLPKSNCAVKITACNAAPTKMVIGADPVARITKTVINLGPQGVHAQGAYLTGGAYTGIACGVGNYDNGTEEGGCGNFSCPTGYNQCTPYGSWPSSGMCLYSGNPGDSRAKACCPNASDYLCPGPTYCLPTANPTYQGHDCLHNYTYNVSLSRCPATSTGEVYIQYNDPEFTCIYCPTDHPVYDPISKNCTKDYSASTLLIGATCSTLNTYLTNAFTDVTFKNDAGAYVSASYIKAAYNCPI